MTKEASSVLLQCLVGLVMFGGVTLALAVAMRRSQSTGAKVVIGLFLTTFGLIALGFGVCGGMIMKN